MKTKEIVILCENCINFSPEEKRLKYICQSIYKNTPAKENISFFYINERLNGNSQKCKYFKQK